MAPRCGVKQSASRRERAPSVIYLPSTTAHFSVISKCFPGRNSSLVLSSYLCLIVSVWQLKPENIYYGKKSLTLEKHSAFWDGCSLLKVQNEWSCNAQILHFIEFIFIVFAQYNKSSLNFIAFFLLCCFPFAENATSKICTKLLDSNCRLRFIPGNHR